MATAVGLALAGPAAPSQAASTQASSCEGVTMVVEFNRLGGGDQIRCAPGDPDSGVAALKAAGYTPTRAAQEAGYFLCRIDGKPADDPCQRASPEDAYWSYWHAEPGGSWTFSNAGAASYDPAPGSVEGWSFGGGEPPSTPPPARRQAPASPRPVATTAAPAPAPMPTARRTAASAPVVPTAAATTTTVPRVTATAAPAPAPRTAAPSPSASPSSDPVPLAVDPPLPSDGDDGGSPLVGILLAVGVVGGLGAAAAFQAQKRR